MALVVNDRVKETSTTAGTGTFTLDGAVTGFETFSSAIGNTNTTYYAIEIPNSTEFEVGLGTVSAGQLARTTVISSSNSDALVDFSAGTKNVFCTLPASKAVIEDASNNVTLPADLTVDTDTLYVDSSNNRVGINTTSPTQALTIGGDANYVSISSNDYDLIKLGPRAASGVNLDRSIFQMYSDGVEKNRLDVNGNTFINGGNVGIGTSSPSNKLHVKSDDTSTAPQLLIEQDGTGDSVLGFKITDAGTSFSMGINNSDGDKFLIAANGTDIGNSPILALTTGGNVGIGTSSPSTLLHLSSADPQITITDTDGTGSQVISASTDDLKFDVVGKTVIDSDSGGTLQLLDGGISYLKFFEFGTYSALESMISDNDFKIRGNDGGSFIDAVTFDMSDLGFAEFNSKIRVEADSSANAILIKGRSADDIGTIKFTANDGSGNQGELSARSSVFIFNTSTQTNLRINNTDKLILTSSQVNLKDTVFVDVNEQIQFGDAGENISGDGTDLTIASSRHIKLDAANDITLDAGAGGVKFDDDGTTVGLLFNASGDLTFKTVQQDKDLNIKGNDGGSEITALTLDMSEAGAATFNDKIILGANKAIEFGDAGESISGDGTDMTITGNIVKIDAANRIILDAAENRIDLHDNGSEFARFVNNGGQLRILTGSSAATAVSFDSSGAATFNSSVTVGANLDVSSGTIKLDGNYPTGTNNVAMGDTALDSLTNGDDNTVIGDGAGTAVTTGQQNTVVGSTALNTGNATGNTAIGFRALRRATGANNTAIGRTAGDDTTTGAQNTFVGGSAGYYINGTNNVAVGYQAGNGLGNTGSSNVFMGYRAGNNNTTGSNNIVIGTSANASSATVSNEITLGDTNVTSLRIPGLASGASSGDVLTYDGTDITLSAPTGVSAGFAVAMAIAL